MKAQKFKCSPIIRVDEIPLIYWGSFRKVVTENDEPETLSLLVRLNHGIIMELLTIDERCPGEFWASFQWETGRNTGILSIDSDILRFYVLSRAEGNILDGEMDCQDRTNIDYMKALIRKALREAKIRCDRWLK